MDNVPKRLVDSALKLFLSQGVHITGVMAIAEQAGVTKMTLYSHFESKDALIVACLDERDRIWRREVELMLERHPDPVDSILAFFDLYQRYLIQDGGRGCVFVNSAAEFPECSHPVHMAVNRHKQGIRDELMGLAIKANLMDPHAAAEGLFVLLEGTFLTGAMAQKNTEVFDTARKMARCWVRQHNRHKAEAC
ncbi:TetR/AcrR family transcriptional regulator [Pseudomonas sp. GD03842]|uniref:TetR/AcrR family transcriptional regulator n=1 Tax=Pseudomonas sp. GD03842 TaxID=2975385 RepID=UPI002449E403|nr:TetR/AcrR family transcriptional regulator [Pseudomonas sp. GD03842]MDH0745158.1 TetR/AcrR family transcriptional regulator [Pseudomonas sp. GD03842]